jgi:hypothetical protein
VLLYDPNVGDGAIVAFDGAGRVRLDTTNKGWRKTWSILLRLG